jgi:hypothetical protein
MPKKIEPIKKLPLIPDERIDRSDLAKRVQRSGILGTLASSPSVPLAPAQRHEVSPTLLKLEHQPLSVYDDNPVLDERSAAFIVGVTADCLKKWRQRNKGPDYIQYGHNGVVRYELNALMEFRDRNTVRIGNGK